MALLACVSPAFSQDAPPPPAPAPSAPPVAPNVKQPDYPDPRTFTIGVYYWATVPGNGPDIRGGKLATGFESLYGLGKDHGTPAVSFSMPITRTGELHLDAFRSQGTGNQTLPADTTVFASDYSKGDQLATNYRVTNVKFYLEDLLWPHKFPVAKFRLKSIWAVQYADVHSSIDALSGSLATSDGSRNSILPSFGVVAEYAIAPHVLLRAGGSGWGLPHRSAIWDGEATISVRHRNFELVGGAKAFHYKSTPNKDEYVIEQIYGGFFGIRYHFGS